MSDLFDVLQERYLGLIARREEGEAGQEFVQDVRAFITDAQRAGASIADLNERSQLRAWMRFLANVVVDATGVYPDVTLQPLARGQLAGAQPEPGEKLPRPFPLAWMLTGGAAAIIIAAGLVAIGWLSRSRGVEVESPIPTPTPLPFVGHVIVGTESEAGGPLEITADTFCLGTPEIVAELTLKGMRSEMEWHWEVKRGETVVAAQPPAPWGGQTQPVTIRALAGGPQGVEPGQYELLVYAGGQVVGVRSFRVLDRAPRIFDLRVADVPELAGEAPGEPAFEAGVRVIYLSYEFEGLCPGLEVSYAVARAGEPIQERVETWSGSPQGRGQVSLQSPGDQAFRPGNYQAVVAVAGQEQGRVRFTIAGVPTETVPAAFGDLTIALGIQPDGTPILTAADGLFDWNTKAVYAIFDYVGMGDGLRWLAVWTRNGEEVARQEYFWDVEADGTEGTHWVVYYDERGRTLPGGRYTVTLYIENVAQRSAEFQILYYVPRE